MLRELWKGVRGFHLYEVSSHGRVRSYQEWVDGKKSRILTPRRQYSGKTKKFTGLTVVLFKNGKRYPRKIAVLVLEAFVSRKPPGMESCHEDGNPANNHYRNLRWDTHDSNMKDTKRHYTTTAKLIPGDVDRIRDLRRVGCTYPQILDWLKPPVGRVSLVHVATGRTHV